MNPSEPFLLMAFDRLRFLAIDDDSATLELIDAMLRMAGAASVIKSMSALAALNILAGQQNKMYLAPPPSASIFQPLFSVRY